MEVIAETSCHAPCPSLTPCLNPMAVMTDNGLDRPDPINLQPRHNMIQILATCNTANTTTTTSSTTTTTILSTNYDFT